MMLFWLKRKVKILRKKTWISQLDLYLITYDYMEIDKDKLQLRTVDYTVCYQCNISFGS